VGRFAVSRAGIRTQSAVVATRAFARARARAQAQVGLPARLSQSTGGYAIRSRNLHLPSFRVN